MDDLISRQAAIAEFSCCELTPDGGIDANYAIDFLEQMPSAQRTGRWIKHEVKLFNGCHTGRYFDECSECGKLTTEWRKVTEYHRWNFCPNCGARMEVNE